MQESQLLAKDATIKQQKIYRNALAIGFSSVVLIVIVIVYAYVQKRKDNKKIVEQNDQILESNEELKVLNKAINKQNHEIIDSISYAERIQAAMLPLGYYQGKDRAFTNHDIKLEQGDTIYLFSEGFIDQKGGMDGKRFLSKNFKDLLIEIQDQAMHDQKDILDKRLSDWMASNSQVDDILVIGVRM